MTSKETCNECEDGILPNCICPGCNGSGEGGYDGSNCLTCGGKGSQDEYCDCKRGDERLEEEVF